MDNLILYMGTMREECLVLKDFLPEVQTHTSNT